MTMQVLSREEAETVSGGSLGSALGTVVNKVLDLVDTIGHSKLGIALGKILGGIVKLV